MKKILIADFVFEKAHKTFNVNIINSIVSSFEADVVSLNGYYEGLDTGFDKKVNIVSLSVKECREQPLSKRLMYSRIIRKTTTIIKKGNYECVIVLAFELLSFLLGRQLLSKIPVVLMHHNNIDQLTNHVKKLVFKSYMNRAYHVVFEAAFKKHLVESVGVRDDRVFVLPHPVALIDDGLPTNIVYDCVGLCSANSDEWIKEIEERDEDFSFRNLKIVMRSKTHSCQLKAVTIISGYLKYEEYCSYYNSAKTAFVAVPDSFVYRLSGSIYDALSRKRIVFTTSKVYAEDYALLYPGICIFVCSIEDLLDKLSNFNISSIQSSSFAKFERDHSIEKTRESIKKIIETVINE